MFIKTQKLEKLMKAARKAGTLVIGQDDADKNYGGYYVAGSYWVCHVGRDDTTAEFLALLVKYAGRIPGCGEEYTVKEDYIQLAIYGARNYYLPERFAKSNHMAHKTPITITMSKDTDLQVYQENTTFKVYCVNKDVAACVDLKQLKEAEDTPEIHMTNEGRSICYGNDTSNLEIWILAFDEDNESCPVASIVKILDGKVI